MSWKCSRARLPFRGAWSVEGFVDEILENVCVAGFHRAWLETILFTSQITGSPPLLSDLDILCEIELEGHRGSSRLNKSEEAWSVM